MKLLLSITGFTAKLLFFIISLVRAMLIVPMYGLSGLFLFLGIGSLFLSSDSVIYGDKSEAIYLLILAFMVSPFGVINILTKLSKGLVILNNKLKVRCYQHGNNRSIYNALPCREIR